jgi:hypothetical protein
MDNHERLLYSIGATVVVAFVLDLCGVISSMTFRIICLIVQLVALGSILHSYFEIKKLTRGGRKK